MKKPKRGPIIRTDYLIEVQYTDIPDWWAKGLVYETLLEAEVNQKGILVNEVTRIIERKWRVL